MKFLTGKHVSRRHILRGVGAGLALPLLDAMLPAARAIAQEVVAPKRFGAVFVPHGERPGFWNPAKIGAGFEPSVILQPLAPYRDELTVVSQLANPVAGHGVTVASWLSGTVPKRTVAEDVRAGKTIDQLIADKIGRDTVLKSLEVATEDFTGYIGGCDPGYACAYFNTLAWNSETEPLPMEINPRNLFERMFGRPGHRRAEARADAHGPQHPRLRPRRPRAARTRRGSAGSLAARRLPRARSRNRGAHRARGTPGRRRHAHSRCTGGYSRLVCQARRAAVRAHRAGL